MKNGKNYETVYILRPDLTDEGEKKIQEKIAEMVKRYEGEIRSVTDMGKRQLAYRIEKHTKGHYFLMNYSGTGKVVEELERHLRFSEDVVRFLTVREKEAEPSQGVPAKQEANV